MVDLLHHTPLLHVWISKDLGVVQDGPARHSDFIQHLEPVGAGPGNGDRFDFLSKLVTVLHPELVTRILRAVDQVRPTDGLGKPFPRPLVGRTQSEVAVRTLDSLVGRNHAMGRAHRLGDPAPGEVLGRLPYRESNPGLQERGIHVLSCSRAQPVDVRSENSLQREEPGA